MNGMITTREYDDLTDPISPHACVHRDRSG